MNAAFVFEISLPMASVSLEYKMLEVSCWPSFLKLCSKSTTNSNNSLSNFPLCVLLLVAVSTFEALKIFEDVNVLFLLMIF